ncbi:MAG: glycosyltransferase [Thermoplasmata archaeon]|nr:MAG: glycosyltransferase [Thermoplasmata archaeon]
MIFLLPYSYLCILLTYGAKRQKSYTNGSNTKHPPVTIQLPIYNENHTIHRLIKAISNIKWPKSKLEILVLDDSKDETSSLVENEITRYRSLGFNIKAIRRADRTGFKAGALQNAVEHSHGEYIVIFDADSTPQEDFLEATIPLLESNSELGFIQTRLGYSNRGLNEMTEAFAIALDNHYQLELPGRQNLYLISTFNGSAGVIRKEALIDIGGWRWYTLTEDADLSARMAINGWKSRYLNEVVVGSEVPYTLDDFIKQQSRWAMGGIQATPKLLKPIWLSKHHTVPQKIEATIHLTNYLAFPGMVISSTLLVALIVLGFDPKPIFYSSIGLVSLIGSLGVSLMYASSLRFAGHRIIGKIQYLSLLGAIGVGMSPRLSVMIVRDLLSKKSEFVVTPKYNADSNSNPTDVVLNKHSKSGAYIEMIFILITLVGIIYSLINKTYIVIISFIIQLLSYLITLYFLRK